MQYPLAMINVSLSSGELETLLTSLEYSKRALSDAQGTPNEIRKENLGRVEAVMDKLRQASRSTTSDS